MVSPLRIVVELEKMGRGGGIRLDIARSCRNAGPVPVAISSRFQVPESSFILGTLQVLHFLGNSLLLTRGSAPPNPRNLCNVSISHIGSFSYAVKVSKRRTVLGMTRVLLILREELALQK